jgi:hypothetical protein
MDKTITSFVGLDVHKDSIAMGIAPIGREAARFVMCALRGAQRYRGRVSRASEPAAHAARRYLQAQR